MNENLNIQLRFDGPDLQEHLMDTKLLGNALLGIAELCEGANETLNGQKARLQVLVRGDIKANCVTIDFQVVQTVWDTAKMLIGNGEIATAKELLEWIGILGGGGCGLFHYLRRKKNRKEESIRTEGRQGGNVTIVKLEGDNNSITIQESVYKLSKNLKVVEGAKAVADPVNELGINEAVFIHDKKATLRIDKSFAEDLQKVVPDPEVNEAQVFTAHIVTHGPVFDTRARHWKFKLNNKIEIVDIGGTNIAEQALVRGGVRVGDTYKVRIEMVEQKTKSGDFKSDFKVIEVLDFIPGAKGHQQKLPFKSDDPQSETTGLTASHS